MDKQAQALIDSILELRKDQSLENTFKFVEELIKTKLMVPISVDESVTERGDDEVLYLKEEAKVKFEGLVNFENDNYMVSFTDKENVLKWNSSLGTRKLILMDFYEISNLFLSNEVDFAGIVINPFGENLAIAKEDFANIRNIIVNAEKEE